MFCQIFIHVLSDVDFINPMQIIQCNVRLLVYFIYNNVRLLPTNAMQIYNPNAMSDLFYILFLLM